MTSGTAKREPDLLWDDVKWCFELDGSLPDVCVHGASVADWQAVLDLVAESGWECRYSVGDTVLPVPRAETALSRPGDAECPSARVWPTADVLAIFRFYSDEEIDFDVDPRELQGQERLDVFCGFLRAIGRRLGKPVLMYPEGGHGFPPLLGYDLEADRIVLRDRLVGGRAAAAYGKIVDAYKLTKVDFDVEGGALPNTAANTRRARAVAELQQRHPALDVSFPLPVRPEGLTQDGVNLLADANTNGVKIDTVNIMAMDCGPAYGGDMGT